MTEVACRIRRRKREKTSGGRRPKTEKGREYGRSTSTSTGRQEERGQAQGLAEYGVSYG